MITNIRRFIESKSSETKILPMPPDMVEIGDTLDGIKIAFIDKIQTKVASPSWKGSYIDVERFTFKDSNGKRIASKTSLQKVPAIRKDEKNLVKNTNDLIALLPSEMKVGDVLAGKTFLIVDEDFLKSYQESKGEEFKYQGHYFARNTRLLTYREGASKEKEEEVENPVAYGVLAYGNPYSGRDDYLLVYCDASSTIRKSLKRVYEKYAYRQYTDIMSYGSVSKKFFQSSKAGEDYIKRKYNINVSLSDLEGGYSRNIPL